MTGTQMAMVASAVGVLLENFVQLRIPGHPTTKMTLIVVVEDVVCPGASTPDRIIGSWALTLTVIILS